MAFQNTKRILCVALALLIPLTSFAASGADNTTSNSHFMLEWAYSANPFANKDELCIEASENANKAMHINCPEGVRAITYAQHLVRYAPPGWVCFVATVYECW